jgi:hypothetical protein
MTRYLRANGPCGQQGVTDVCANRVGKKRYWIAVAILLCGLAAGEETSPKITIRADGQGGFTFDTGVLRGTLCPDGKLQGLTSVTHVPSGTRLDRSMGILSYYRVFTTGKRYGTGAWEWPATAKLLSDTAVQVTAPATPERPFDLTAVYRWTDPQTLDLETTVAAHVDVNGFESFLASYFDEAFSSPYVYARRPRPPSPRGEIRYPSFLLAEKSYGDWLMFTEFGKGTSMIRDGRWSIEPNPVNWTILDGLAGRLCFRRNQANGLTAVLMAPTDDCFAIATPYAGEAHHSLYLSLFGRNLKAGQIAKARTRFVVASGVSDQQVTTLYYYHYALYLRELSRPTRSAEATDKR